MDRINGRQQPPQPTKEQVKKLRDILKAGQNGGEVSVIWGPNMEREDDGEVQKEAGSN